MSVDVAFITGANSDLGFGHASRCLHLARLAQGAGLSCGLFGAFSAEASGRIKAYGPDITVGTEDEAGQPRVSVVDRLFDPDDADSVDVAAIERFRSRGAKVLAIVSGTSLPDVPGDVIVIGYQPAKSDALADNVRWGLEYAPVPPGVGRVGGCKREASQALVALGGHDGFAPLLTVCAALASVSRITTVELLVSPVARDAVPHDLRIGKHQSLVKHRDVPDVLALLARAGIVIASYGNLMFEALAVGGSVCVVGQKQFQIDLAGRMATLGLCIDGGATAADRTSAISDAIERTLDRREELSRRAAGAVDGAGLERIAGLIVEAARHG